METMFLDSEGIPGNCYKGKGNIGIVLGLGILGNRFGLEHAAMYLAEQIPAHVVTLDPPSHHLNKLRFTFGNNAEDQRRAARFLRGRMGCRTIIGGGHSGGAMGGIFAATGYTNNIEDLVLQDRKAFEMPEYEKLFDGLILAGLPLSPRTATPGYMFHSWPLFIAHKLFHRQNKTRTENLTTYIGKPEARHEWKHLFIDDIPEIREYVQSMPTPVEYVELLAGTCFGSAPKYARQLRKMPKLVLVGGRDILSFGLGRILWSASEEQQEQYSRMIDKLGSHEFKYYPGAAHFLNDTDRFEMDSLWGLRSERVLNDIIGFVREHYVV